MKVLCLYSVFFLSLFPGLAQAITEQTVYPSGSSDQTVINQAIETVYNSGGGTVYLNAGVYDISNTITMKSNIKLTGDPKAILRVSASYQWFTFQTGVISNPDESLHDVEICNFDMDGNIGSLPRAWDSTPTHARDCEKMILIGGWSSSMGSNISVHDMRIYNAFSDGIYIRFTDGVYLYNDFISDCQHEGVYLSACRGGSIYDNKIAGICSDNGRLDNCQNFLIKNNVFFSYSGDTYGAFAHGEDSLQIGNQGEASHGYTPTAKPFTTLNIEVTNNTFVSPGLQAFSLSGGENVYIHNNIFKDASELETSGISIGNYSYNNPPTLKTSEDVFSSILNGNFFFQYLEKQIPINATVSISYYNNSYNPHSLVYVDGEGLTGVKYTYSGVSANHYFSINGENTDLWTGNLQHIGNAVYLNGSFDAKNLQVTCYKSQGYSRITDFNITVVPDDSAKILSPELWAFVGTLTILGFSIYRNFRRVINKW